MERLRVAAFCVYLATWLVFVIAAVTSAIPVRGRQVDGSARMTVPAIIGLLMQVAAALTVTLSMGSGPLRPRPFELVSTLALAPLAASLFVWALRSTTNTVDAEVLATGGAYAWLRHPIYLAFLAMLVATGLLISAGLKLAAAVVLYLAGSELRIVSEEAELSRRFPVRFAQYRLRTRWRYLPGLR